MVSIVARSVASRSTFKSPATGQLFDISMYFPGLYQKGNFIGQSPSCVTVVYLSIFAQRDLIGRQVRLCLKCWTFRNFSMQATEPTKLPTMHFKSTPCKVNEIHRQTCAVCTRNKKCLWTTLFCQTLFIFKYYSPSLSIPQCLAILISPLPPSDCFNGPAFDKLF